VHQKPSCAQDLAPALLKAGLQAVVTGSWTVENRAMSAARERFDGKCGRGLVGTLRVADYRTVITEGTVVNAMYNRMIQPMIQAMIQATVSQRSNAPLCAPLYISCAPLRQRRFTTCTPFCAPLTNTITEWDTF